MTNPRDPNFYLGRLFDLPSGKVSGTPVFYDPSNLTTHAVVTGMTGSGKTGLCIGLLEEAALHGIPALIVDPKGDLTNLMLHFPDLAPSDFESWIDPDAARREAKTIPQMAIDTAQKWRDGLASWGLGSADIQDLQSSAEFTVYTPGSTSGKPINILASFQPPEIPWLDNQELLREKIATTVTALLSLVGMDEIDPLRSREHILLSNIMEASWSQNKPLDLTELILQTQTPPFTRLGAFPIDSLFPEKDRLQLAMLLNNFLASPTFQTWLQGQTLDIQSLLFSADGRPRHSIFYMAHLNDNERMFFTTLLFAATEAWMRTQRGTSGLRALLYFDEILGYLPPMHNPPSKPILLRMLKQARAFGVGLLLATQNPVDLDYKALSNAGTWMIGRLQTEQDKQRLLDGLQSADGGVERSTYDRLISGLQKRVFILHNVNNPAPQLFQTRWTLNYLAGPMTRAQIPDLNRLKTANIALPTLIPQSVTPSKTLSGAATRPISVTPAPKPVEPSSVTRPAIPDTLGEYFVPIGLSVNESAARQNLNLNNLLQANEVVYKPALLGQAQIRYLAPRYKLDYERHLACLLTSIEGSIIQWEENPWQTYFKNELMEQPLPQARYINIPDWIAEAKRTAAIQKDFLDWVYRNAPIRLQANESLKVYAGPQVTSAQFREMCSNVARDSLQAELSKNNAANRAKISAIKIKIDRQEVITRKQKEEVDHRRLEQMTTDTEFVLSIFSRRKRSLSRSATKHRMTQDAAGDYEKQQAALDALKDQLAELERIQADGAKQAQDRWAQMVNDLTEIPFAPARKDVFLELFGVAWMPYYQVKVGDSLMDLPAFPPAPR